jgi:hypothetical protein
MTMARSSKYYAMRLGRFYLPIHCSCSIIMGQHNATTRKGNADSEKRNPRTEKESNPIHYNSTTLCDICDAQENICSFSDIVFRTQPTRKQFRYPKQSQLIVCQKLIFRGPDT